MILLEGATIVTSEKEAQGSILIEDGKIADVYYCDSEDYNFQIFKAKNAGAEVEDCSGLHIMAGGIDAHVHFREPGLTHKADMASESRAAVAGGVTTVIDMPNTNPVTTGAKELKEKISLATGRCAANIYFHIGATNSNHHDLAYMARHGCPEEGIKDEDIAGIIHFWASDIS